MIGLGLGLSLTAVRTPTRAHWWASAAWQASDNKTGLTLGPAALLDFGGNRYALTEGWWEMPDYAARDADGVAGPPAAILDFSSDRYAR